MKLPDGFVKEIESYNSPLLENLIDSLTTEPSVSVRCNIAKNILPPDGSSLVKWCRWGFYLEKRQPFTFDPAMHQGLYYVQDASSMIISHIVSTLVRVQKEPLLYLDACAAPGGKTTAVMDVLPENSLVVSNEFVPQRANVLVENVSKWGNPNVIVSKGDTAKYRKLKNIFDIIAIDAPCSGEGMFRKEPDAVAQWSKELVQECADRQREIISNLWNALRPGGYMIYSTCTFNRLENEEILDYICDNFDAQSIDVDIPDDWNIAQGVNTSHHCYRFMPHKVNGEGLFIAVIRKNESDESKSIDRTKKIKNKPQKVDKTIINCRNWINDADNYDFIVENENLIAFPNRYNSLLSLLKSHLNIVYYGINVGKIKGKDIIPDQSLALSIKLNINSFNRYSIDYNTAISYLRREAIILPDDCPRGYVLLMYNDRPLGFVKNLGNRANNLYPQDRRILSSHTPDEIPSIL